jgi:hypothetical protein
MEYHNLSRPSRRTFLFEAFMATVGRVTTYAQQQAPIPETLTQWLEAPARMRKLALQRCRDRIQTMDPSIHAWVQVSPQKNTGRGHLSGIPYGVKDIVETRGLATEYGSPIYKGRIGTTDAAIIREMRRHGAILLGKTQTTAFAYQTPAPTRNPRDLEHTPWSTRPVEVQAARRPQLRRAWFRSLSESKPAGPCCGRRLFAALLDSNPLMVFSQCKACYRCRRAWTRSGSSRIRPPICRRFGIHWVVPRVAPKILISEYRTPFPMLNQRWRRRIRMLFHVCAARAHRSDPLISLERSLSLPRQT